MSEDQCQTTLMGNCPKWLSGKNLPIMEEM